MSIREARQVWISGRVQGVAFRYSAHEQASALAVVGWVRNLADGRVEAWIEGQPGSVERMLAWLRVGPRAAHVQGLDVRERDAEGYAGFEIRPTVRP